jgi:Flp pilus assembly protein TadG
MRTGRHEGERGQALVEFAMTIPIVLAVMFGIVDFGRALYTYDLVTSAARVGSRYASVHGSGCSPAPSCTASSATIQAYVRSTVNGINSSVLTVTTTWPAATGCAGGSPTPQCPVKVTVSYPFQFLLSFNLTVTITNASQVIIWR